MTVKHSEISERGKTFSASPLGLISSAFVHGLILLLLAVPVQAQSWWNPSDAQGSFARLVEGRPASSDSLIALGSQLTAICGRLENPNAAGIVSKIVLPSGDIVRVGEHFDSDPALFTKSWTWVPQPGHVVMPPCVPSNTPGPQPPTSGDLDALLSLLAEHDRKIDTKLIDLRAYIETEAARLHLEHEAVSHHDQEADKKKPWTEILIGIVAAIAASVGAAR